MEDKKNYDLQRIIEDIHKPTKSLEFKVIGFTYSNEWELSNLPRPKSGNNFYTATFFCRKEDQWFMKQAIFDVKNTNILCDGTNFNKRLESGARAILDAHKRSKNPYKYLKDINIYPEEGI